MRYLFILLITALALLNAPALAAGEHLELYNIGITVAMEEELTTITLFLDGAIEPVPVETEEESILVFDLHDVELTAADEGVTSFAVFSPSVASIKLTQIETEPYITRLEIYTNGKRDYDIKLTADGIDFLIFPFGMEPAIEEGVAEPEAEIAEEEGIGETPAVEEAEAEPPPGEDPLGYRPIPEDEWVAPEAPVEEPVEEVEIVEPGEEGPAEEEAAPWLEEIVIPEPAEEEEETGLNLLEGVNLLTPEEEEAAAEEAVAEEPAVPSPETVEEEPIIETVAPAPAAGSVKLASLNFQAGDADTDMLVFTMVDDYPGEVRTNFAHKKGFIVLSLCDVSDFVKPGEFKSVELSGMHLRYVVININDAGEAVFSLILMDPEAAYEMVVETIDNKVNIYLRLVE